MDSKLAIKECNVLLRNMLGNKINTVTLLYAWFGVWELFFYARVRPIMLQVFGYQNVRAAVSQSHVYCRWCKKLCPSLKKWVEDSNVVQKWVKTTQRNVQKWFKRTRTKKTTSNVVQKCVEKRRSKMDLKTHHHNVVQKWVKNNNNNKM